MKSIILAAGYATRLYPLTENFPKPLLQIGSNTILGRLLDDIDGIPEVDEHIIVTNAKFAGQFEQWAYERSSVISSEVEKSHKPVTVLSDGTYTNETRLGAVKDLIMALNVYAIEDDILVLAADNILDFSLKGFVEEFHRKGTSMIMCHHEPEIYKLQRTGVIEVDADMKVLQMQEKPEVPVSNWAVPPFYIYRREDLDLVRHSIENGCGSDAPGNLARYLVGLTPIHAWPMPADRFDIGSLDTYAEAQRRYAAAPPEGR